MYARVGGLVGRAEGPKGAVEPLRLCRRRLGVHVLFSTKCQSIRLPVCLVALASTRADVSWCETGKTAGRSRCGPTFRLY